MFLRHFELRGHTAADTGGALRAASSVSTVQPGVRSKSRGERTFRRKFSKKFVPLDQLRSIFSGIRAMGEGTFPLGMADRAMRLTEREQDAAAGQMRVHSVRHRENCDLTRQVFSCCPPFFSCREIGIPGREKAVCRPESTHRTGQQSTAQHSRVQYSTVQHSTVQQSRKSPPFPEGNSGPDDWFLDTAVRLS